MLRGAGYMVAASASFTAMAVAAKLASAEVSAGIVVLVRSAVIAAVALGMLRLRGVPVAFHDQQTLWARDIAGYIAMLCYFWALSAGPLADVMALQYTAPLFVAAFAPVLLRERVTPRTWGFLVVGFAGALCLLRPGGSVHPALLAALASAAFAALAYVAVRRLAATDDPDCVVLHFALFSTVLSLPALATLESMPSGQTLLALGAVGLFASGGQMGMTRAYLHGDAARISGISFIAVPMGAFTGVQWFGEELPLLALAGAALVIVGGVGLSWKPRSPR